MRPLDAEEEKAKEGLDRLSISDLLSVTDVYFRYHMLNEYRLYAAALHRMQQK